eukprot:c16095_g1_i1.p1 GENE.c16095_g1_i1~~c16095_g1_i1.p1  ORF type:complete len:562 (+),score=147.86 c16095_g1_i1:218-1903(+)
MTDKGSELIFSLSSTEDLTIWCELLGKYGCYICSQEVDERLIRIRWNSEFAFNCSLFWGLVRFDSIWHISYCCVKYGAIRFLSMLILMIFCVLIPFGLFEIGIGQVTQSSVVRGFDRLLGKKYIGVSWIVLFNLIQTTFFSGYWTCNSVMSFFQKDFVEDGFEYTAFFGPDHPPSFWSFVITVLIWTIVFIVVGSGPRGYLAKMSEVMYILCVLLLLSLLLFSLIISGPIGIKTFFKSVGRDAFDWSSEMTKDSFLQIVIMGNMGTGVVGMIASHTQSNNGKIIRTYFKSIILSLIVHILFVIVVFCALGYSLTDNETENLLELSKLPFRFPSKIRSIFFLFIVCVGLTSTSFFVKCIFDVICEYIHQQKPSASLILIVIIGVLVNFTLLVFSSLTISRISTFIFLECIFAAFVHNICQIISPNNKKLFERMKLNRLDQTKSSTNDIWYIFYCYLEPLFLFVGIYLVIAYMINDSIVGIWEIFGFLVPLIFIISLSFVNFWKVPLVIPNLPELTQVFEKHTALISYQVVESLNNENKRLVAENVALKEEISTLSYFTTTNS